MKLRKVLCIGGSDSSGGAGIQADLKAVSACGCWGLTVVTAVTAQNTKGVSGIYPVDPAFVAKQMDVVLSDIGVDAIKTGMLPTEEIIQAVVKKIKKYKLKNVVVDPVMIAKGGRTLMTGKARQMLVQTLLPLALVITPNIPEAETLSKNKIKTMADMKDAAAVIYESGAANVVIKGGHLPDRKHADVTDILYSGSGYCEFSSARIRSCHTHGTGCTFASGLASGLARRKSLADAVLQAKITVADAIRKAVVLGHGYGSVNVFEKFS
jgi:hydroxymethylpyrimidine kinase/phosphomethylpyrimidine kinase